MKGIGNFVQIGVAREASRGIAESAAAFYMPFSDGSVNEKQDRIVDDQGRGVLEDSFGESIVSQEAEITLKGNLGDKIFPLFLLSALGNLVTSANADASGNVKDHVITVAQSATPQSLTIFKDDPVSGVDYKHPLGSVESIDLTADVKKFIEVSLKLKAKKGTVVAGGLTPAGTTENYFLPQHLTFKLANSIADLDTASAFPIKTLKLKIAKSIENNDVLGNSEPDDFLTKGISIDGEFEAIWQNETDFKQAALSGAYKAMRISIVNSDVTIGTTAHPALIIDFNKVALKDLVVPLKVGDVLRQTVQFTAHYDISASKMVSIKATNNQLSY